MPFDGITTKKIITELQNTIVGGKINKVFIPSRNEILLSVYTKGKNETLLINISSSYYRMHLTHISKPNPMTPLHFCMVLRKHLIGYVIKNISSEGLDRVVTIDLQGYNELNDVTYKKLIIELMGKYSNVVLTNEKGIIIDSFKHFSSSETSREILPAHPYLPVENVKKDILSVSQSEFMEDVIHQKQPIDKIISSLYTGISTTFIKYQLENLAKEASLPHLYTSILQIYNHLADCTRFTIYEKDYTVEYGQSAETASEFLDQFYATKEELALLSSYRNNLLKLVLANLNRITKKLQVIQEKQKECEEMDIFRIYGELLTANLYQISSDYRKDSITLNNFYEENTPITIPLNTTMSPADNAKNYFKKYHKLKNTREIVAKQKQEFSLLLDYLQSIIFELENAQTLQDIDEIYEEITENHVLKIGENPSGLKTVSQSKVKKVAPKKTSPTIEPLTYCIDGFTFLVGKNNKQNDYLSTKVGRNEDLWFHTKDFHGSHGILKCNGSSEKVTQDTIIACAKIVANHSKAKNSSNVPVDYCFVKYVKKPSGSKPGMVIYTHNKTVYVTP